MASISGAPQLSQAQQLSASEITTMINTVSRVAFHVISSYEAIYRVGNLIYHAVYDYVILPLITVGEFINNKIRRVYLRFIEPTFFPDWRSQALVDAVNRNSVQTVSELIEPGALFYPSSVYSAFIEAAETNRLEILQILALNPGFINHVFLNQSAVEIAYRTASMCNNLEVFDWLSTTYPFLSKVKISDLVAHAYLYRHEELLTRFFTRLEADKEERMSAIREATFIERLPKLLERLLSLWGGEFSEYELDSILRAAVSSKDYGILQVVFDKCEISKERERRALKSFHSYKYPFS